MDEKEKMMPEENEIDSSYSMPSRNPMVKKILIVSVIALLVVGTIVLVVALGGKKDDEFDSAYKDNQFINPTETTTGGDGNSTTDGTGTTGTNEGNLEAGGANTEGGWGPIITP